jgi:hypothetical protein
MMRRNRRAGSCSISHALTATAWRLSRLEWLKNTRATSAILRVQTYPARVIVYSKSAPVTGRPAQATVAVAAPSHAHQSLGRMGLLCRRSQGGCRCGE